MKKLALLCLCTVIVLTGCQAANSPSEVPSEPISEVVSEEVVSETSRKENYDYEYASNPALYADYDTNTLFFLKRF